MIKKKKKRTPFIQFASDFEQKYCAGLKESEHWKDDFLSQYGFVWARWNIDASPEKILEELASYLQQKESFSRDGVFYVKAKGDRIRILCKSQENFEVWQKILFMRLAPTTKMVVSDVGNVSFDLELTDIERKIINEGSKASRV